MGSETPGRWRARCLRSWVLRSMYVDPLFSYSASASNGSVALSFVIPTRVSWHAARDLAACAPFFYRKAHVVRGTHRPQQETRGSAAEGSAVLRTRSGNVF